MPFLPSSDQPLWLNALVFAGAAVAVWLAGTRLATDADELADRKGLGKAFAGLLLLGGITSLPEGATSVTAGLAGDAELAVNNILGGVAMQVAVLAAVDAVMSRRSLTARVTERTLLLQGSLGMILLAGIAVAVLVGDLLVLGVGLWSAGWLAATLAGVYVIHRSEGRRSWVVPDEVTPPRESREAKADERSDRGLWLGIAATAVAILVAGVVLARGGSAIAEQTGLGSSFVGAVLVSTATSLPEISTTVAAVRLGQHALAIGDILGSNILNLTFLFLIDLCYAGPPVLQEAGRFAAVAALIGVVITGVFVVGMLERIDRTVLRMGPDSLLVLLLYGAGLVLLYHLR